MGILLVAGAYWRGAGQWRQASDAVLLARAEAQPADADAQAALGRRLRERGQEAAAVFAFERALKSRPKDQETRRELARLLLALEQADAALVHMREIVRRDPKDAFAQEHLGRYYLSRGALSWALQAFEQVVAVQPDNAAAWAHLGDACLALHQAARATEAFEQACAKTPDRPEFRIGLARAHLEAGRDSEAEALLRRETDGPAGAQAAYWLATLFARSPGAQGSREAEAIRLLEESCRKEPGVAGPRLMLGRLLLNRSQTRQAIVHLERANALTSGAPEPLYYLARAYRETGRPAEARACLERFDALSRFQRQRQELEFRLALSPEDPALQRRLNDLYARNESLLHAGDHAHSAAESEARAPESKGGPQP